ncbi:MULTISPECIES: hypothetical protein [Rhizobium/Agrobacterium group]|uniref:TNase-like domain-containing protein n=1 Tax=Allorhizobium ampelinum (strain ATCC BAA-846 / DSM 112012 / S4) TaxID=311402 RepID=B9K5Z8_ALLAM|nr:MULTISPECIES: hypothetical protein [Rhizobium/Agrobacterium group]ACM40296.1 conserved hypothetical protein [Allorhizobium ampelinum S4]MCL6655611.1 hypothetical protein [Agrobacterium rubi]
MIRTIITALAGCAMATQAFAAPAINKDYVKSLAAPGKTALVIEYYDGNGKVVDRKGYATASGFKAVSGTDFKIDDKTTVHLYGLQPCKGDLVNRTEDYAGTCDDYALKQLQVMLQSPKVVFCRAFVSEQGATMQNATCYGYYNYPGAMDSVDNFEEQLLSLGALRLAKKPDGSVERPDLQEAEKLGKKGDFGMWADPRVKSQ